MSPFFSVITCTRNSQSFLADNLNSLSKQTCRDFEHIFIDGESTDQTQNLLGEYQKQHPNQVIIYKQPALGIASAMNLGIEKATGAYVIHLHSDDYLYDEKVLERVKAFLAGDNKPWLYGQINTIKADKQIGVFPARQLFKKGFVFVLKLFNYIPHQATFIKRSLFQEVGMFNTSLKYCMDYDLWLRLSAFCKPHFIPVVISNYRLHPKAASSSRQNIKEVNLEYKQVQYSHTGKIGRILVLAINLLVFAKSRRLSV